MMRRWKQITAIFCAAALALVPTGCGEDLNIDPVTPVVPVDGGGKTDPPAPTDRPTEPAKCSNKVVAHRGGSSECGAPDNSRASLKYAMSLGCYAMECDIYWTKDNDVVIAHATDTYYINGLRPWENTLEQLRRAGKLKNGEELPSLSDFLDIVQVDGNCTKLCLDIKNLDGNLTDYPIKAVQRACEIIAARKAEKFCEFICTGNKTVARGAAACQVKYGIPVGWMSPDGPSTHLSYGFTWANLSTEYVQPYGTSTTKRTIDEYLKAGMQFSVFNVDKTNSDEVVAYYVSRYKDLRCICTNYPKWLLSKL